MNRIITLPSGLSYELGHHSNEDFGPSLAPVHPDSLADGPRGSLGRHAFEEDDEDAVADLQWQLHQEDRQREAFELQLDAQA